MMALVGVLCAVMGALAAWLVARRGNEAGRRQAEVELTAARTQLAGRDELLRRLEQQLATLGAQLQQDGQQLGQAREALARAEAQARAAEATLEAVKHELSSREAALAQAQHEVASRGEQLARVRAEAEAAAARLAALERLEAEAQAAASALAAARAAQEATARRLATLEAIEGEHARLLERAGRLEAELDAERSRAAERLSEAQAAKETMRLEFEALAQKLLEEKGKAMLEQGQKGLEGLLTPVKERLKQFEETFARTYQEESRDRVTLLERLRLVAETQQKLNDGAEALARALTSDSKAQGDWGELVLERLLETAGLTRGREYELQVHHQDEDGARLRPDALVYLPQQRAIVVDAKCSLTAFVAASRATDEAERERQLDAHVASVKAHVRELSVKDYTAVLAQRSLDLTFMFIPNEAAFHAALARSPRLFEEAFAQRVVLCSPMTLLAALQVVSHVWRGERQTKNAETIAEEAGKMVDKLALALDAFNELGGRLDAAKGAWETARDRLATGRGNALGLARKVHELGARVRKPEKLEAARKSLGVGDEDDGPAALPAPGELPQA